MSDYFLETQHHEWILTNQLGGYALGTGNLVNQRKYHGLLIGGYKELERRHLLAGLEERVEWRGEDFYMDNTNYSNCIYPEGFFHLVKSWLRPYPVFLYSSLPHNNFIMIMKEIMLDSKSNTVMIRYTNLGHHLLHMLVRPKITMRNHHDVNIASIWDTTQINTVIGIGGNGTFMSQRTDNGFELHGYAPGTSIDYDTVIYENVYYPWAVMRGYDGLCDLISAVKIKFDLKPPAQMSMPFS
ncbi:MAG: glycogen debranching enzyme N-terminal domain-containing protein, partial [Candidatus Cloacimonetes bacterium]|nr:glycogen debranching enzyme N-terminal domain-containing protein [Candidatus Cloacimonadota bacterium]